MSGTAALPMISAKRYRRIVVQLQTNLPETTATAFYRHIAPAYCRQIILETRAPSPMPTMDLPCRLKRNI